jgi:quercetin dioxygenase-like cupin family protein
LARSPGSRRELDQYLPYENPGGKSVTTRDDEARGEPIRGESSGAVSGVVDLAAIAGAATVPGAAWTHVSEDLNANLLVFAADEGVDPHVNAEVDVLLVGVAGTGIVEVDGVSHELCPSLTLVVPKGTRRGTRALSDSFACLTCHRRRAGLWPRRNSRPGARLGSHASDGT